MLVKIWLRPGAREECFPAATASLAARRYGEIAEQPCAE